MPFWKRTDDQPIRNPKNRISDQGLVFRRSRTLTGTSSSQVSVANESKAQIKSPRLKEHELKKHRRKLLAGLAGIIGLGVFCVWLLDQYIVTIPNVESVHPVTRSLPVAEYQKTVDEYLDGRPAERFRFMLNEETLVTFIQEKQPEIVSIEIQDATGFAAASMLVDIRKPVAVWQVGQTKYYVDANGESYQQNYYEEPTVSVKDESGINPETTELVASSRLLRFLGRTVSGLNTSGIGTVTSVIIPGGTLRQLDVILDSKPYRIKTHMDREARGQVADIRSAITYIDSKNITPEYIDVRVEGKAFYR